MYYRMLNLFIMLIGCSAGLSSAATTSIRVEWQFTAPNEPLLGGYNLYQEGILTCQTLEPSATFMECHVPLTGAVTNFTMTAVFNDGSESSHSAPYSFSLRDRVQELYVGYLARAADQNGLKYWVENIVYGVLSLDQLRSNLINEQPEYNAIYYNLSRRELVSRIYLNLFMREPDPAGEAYWVTGGGTSVRADQLVVALINAASASDKQTLDNAVKVANYYTTKLGDASHFDLDMAAAVIAQVDHTSVSVTTAMAIIDSWSGL